MNRIVYLVDAVNRMKTEHKDNLKFSFSAVCDTFSGDMLGTQNSNGGQKFNLVIKIPWSVFVCLSSPSTTLGYSADHFNK